ncbi:MAG: glycoside hydrolase domain-containing protein [Mucilaginibacter sp.]|uniref:glycoside hydrolase domain-containing protein n=1 Tax=Mucilaginibacter sp. TaxID=1882438 RepID=UPI0032678D7A
MRKYLAIIISFACLTQTYAQQISAVEQVNVFVGSSGDHGQMSPSASYPFGMLSIGPQTYPNGHTGYENRAKLFLGFTHNRVEGVGCKGSGGNILIKPFIGNDAKQCELIKGVEKAGPGYYSISFANGINTEFTVAGKAGVEHYHFPAKEHGFMIDLSHALSNRFKAERHAIAGNSVSGWIEAGTTCQIGTYKVYYYLSFGSAVKWGDTSAHVLNAMVGDDDVTVRIAFSSVSVAYAKAAINAKAFETVKAESRNAWDKELSRIKVSGDAKEARLFYSMLYRTIQSPYEISEPDGAYRSTNGTLQHSASPVYNGWAIWDNYRTQLPLLSLMQPARYQGMMTSLANLYKAGKKDYATPTEPSNTVRTEHAIVVLLDAYRKGYAVDFKGIRDSLLSEAGRLDFSHPDKALESSYDTWAMAQILDVLKEDSLSKGYLRKANEWRNYWVKDFKDLTKNDVDKMEARGMYQGTIWQYRWFVPFDNKGLMELCGGENAYIKQLDKFFKNDLYNHANEPDIQAPYMYNFTQQPWKSQNMIRKYAQDTVVQYYFNDNSKGIDPFVDRIYTNRPDTYIRTMDDDAGAMSGWYVLAACGLSPACVGWPVYYLHVPLFKTVSLAGKYKPLNISVVNYGYSNRYIGSVMFNGKVLNRNWLTQQEILTGGSLVITASTQPNQSFGIANQWVSAIDLK